MSTIDVRQKAAEKLRDCRVAVLGLLMSGLVGIASAATDLNATLGPLLDSVAALFTPLLNLILAAIPLIVSLAMITFILGILSAILNRLKVG